MFGVLRRILPGVAAAAAVWGWLALRPSATIAPIATPPATAQAPAAVVPAPPPAPMPQPPIGSLAQFPNVAARDTATSSLTAAADARRQGDLRATLAFLQNAVERAPAVETHAALGGLYLELGAAGAADPHLRAAAEADPGSADRWLALANALALKPDPIAAAHALERARTAEPGLRVTRDATGRLIRHSTPTAH